MKVAVKFFARARDLAGVGNLEFDLPETSRLVDVKQLLAEKVPALSPLMSNLLFAVGTEYANDGTELPANADIACFPPVSGG